MMGNGGALNGQQSWVDLSGNLNNTSFCPGSKRGQEKWLIFAEMPGFIEVGPNNKDNSGIDVTVKNLTIQQFNSVGVVNKNASLTFENFKAYKTWNTYKCTAKGLIGVEEGATLTIRDSEFIDFVAWAGPGLGTAIVGGQGVGDLEIERSVFKRTSHERTQFLINWVGEAGSKVNIVSSRFQEAGGILILGDGETNFVNSIWVGSNAFAPDFGERFLNESSGDMNIIASSLRWVGNNCPGDATSSLCDVYSIEYLIETRGSGNINFIQSAVGFIFPDQGGEVTDYFKTLGAVGSGGFTADEYTWIQPTEAQER